MAKQKKRKLKKQYQIPYQSPENWAYIKKRQAENYEKYRSFIENTPTKKESPP